MAITIAEAKGFVEQARKFRDNWKSLADKSWAEIKKRQRNGRLWSVVPNSLRKRSRYPAWYSIFKIRQPLLLSRIGVPIGKDTTQDGIDNIGATAAICLERLAINLARAFDFFDVMSSCRDDFLATNFAMSRGYFECSYVKERVKEYLVPTQTLDGDMVFTDSNGNEVLSDDIGQDDTGFFIELKKIIDVEDEKVFLEPILYKHAYIDPNIRRWSRCKRLAIEEYYSVPEFKQIFGEQAYLDLSAPDDSGSTEEDAVLKKAQLVKVYEYWDEYENETYWFAENGSDFIKPKKDYQPEGEDDDSEYDTRKGLYNLEGFFPCPPPLVINQPTDEFWPVPEYYQLVEIFEDIHTIFSRMVTLTKSIRTRLLFDANIEGLQPALNEAGESDAFGVTNLSQVLSRSGGTLEGAVQYIPVSQAVDTLNNLYTALENRLNTIYKLTGTSDLLQGLITDPTQRTFGERQMTEKYALNQIAEAQRKMQEFVRANYQLLCEMALKNFKQISLDKYIIPQTLQPEHQQRYQAAIALLRDDNKRFRIELETDSTIALNEEYDKQVRIELVNTLTASLEKTANVAETSPALVVPTLHAMKFLIQGFRQGKLFQTEITQAIDNVIKLSESAPEPFNKERADSELQQRKQMLEEQKSMMESQLKQFEMQLESYRAQNDVALKSEQLKLEQWTEQLKAQIEMARLEIEKAKAGVEMQNKMADNSRLEALAWKEMQTPILPEAPEAPQIVVVPSAPTAPIIVAPQGPPQTIINAPNPVPSAPQTSIIQPVQEVPVPVPVMPTTQGVI